MAEEGELLFDLTVGPKSSIVGALKAARANPKVHKIVLLHRPGQVLPAMSPFKSGKPQKQNSKLVTEYTR